MARASTGADAGSVSPALACLVEHEQRGPPSTACLGDRLGAIEDGHALAMEVARQLRGQPRAAAPRRAADHDHHARTGARPLPRVPQPPQLGVAPEQRRGRLELARQLDRRRRHERLVVAQDRRVELAQLGARLDADLPDERRPRVAVRLERVGLAAAAVERQQQLRAQALAQRMLGDERLELRDQRPLAPERELGLDPLLPPDQVQLLEPLDVDARERLELEIRERPAAPQALAVPQHPGRASRVPLLERSPPLGQQPLEAVQVELAGLDVHEVAGRAREEDRVGAERLAQPRHVDLDGVARRRRRVLGPQLLDQAIAGDDPVGLQQQDRQQRALLRAAEREPVPVRADLERTEDAEVDASRGPATLSQARLTSIESALRAPRATVGRCSPRRRSSQRSATGPA